jgi:ribose 5-phosphate isomerase B
MVRFARGDNNANIIAIGADYINLETAISLVKLFVETPFSDKERHLRRVEKITNYETSKNN